MNFEDGSQHKLQELKYMKFINGQTLTFHEDVIGTISFLSEVYHFLKFSSAEKIYVPRLYNYNNQTRECHIELWELHWSYNNS